MIALLGGRRHGGAALLAVFAVLVTACIGPSGSGGDSDAGARPADARPSEDATEEPSGSSSGGSGSGGGSGGTSSSSGGIPFDEVGGPEFAPDGCAYVNTVCQDPSQCCSGNCDMAGFCSGMLHPM
jgi:hypothetical protein